MTVAMPQLAEADLDQAFQFYNSRRPGLGERFVAEFRHAINRILQHPRAWHPMDETYRRCQLHRFPYGVIYRIDDAAQEIVVVAVMHMHRQPDAWRRR